MHISSYRRQGFESQSKFGLLSTVVQTNRKEVKVNQDSRRAMEQRCSEATNRSFGLHRLGCDL
ncbi:hypothetical protein HOLleu_36970 [Holothuria leucospilota]|uniref:Uncharacterized protein n=1 Tax=Holothuria leucospilota TaxID=206669 RepID=A0A9Q0YKM0_HOLLE|nr:hypothetical protein HOLleu_36970 [Holothuria leucospilota]